MADLVDQLDPTAADRCGEALVVALGLLGVGTCECCDAAVQFVAVVYL